MGDSRTEQGPGKPGLHRKWGQPGAWRGELSPSAKLRANQVHLMRRLYLMGLAPKEIRDLLKLDTSVMYTRWVVTGRRWAYEEPDVVRECMAEAKRRHGAGFRRYSDEQIRALRDWATQMDVEGGEPLGDWHHFGGTERGKGLTCAQLEAKARELGMSPRYAMRVVAGQNRRDI